MITEKMALLFRSFIQKKLQSKLITLFITSFVLIINIGAIAQTKNMYNDGPYVKESSNNMREVTWICQGQELTKVIDSKSTREIEGCNMTTKLWHANPAEKTQLVYQGDFKVAAVSDIHGQFDLFIKLLQNNGIIDKHNNWNFGNGHFVITGDVFDRGPQVTEALWFLYDLEKQAEQKGGKVHLLLGNHEVMVLNGSLRFLHRKYINASELLERPFNKLFVKGTVLGDWLRSLPVLIKINGMLFAHGGFHPDLVIKKLTLSDINQAFKQQLVENELPNKQRHGTGRYLHERDGPIWYRGYFVGDLATNKDIEQLLKHFAVSHIIVGHTTQDHITAYYQGKVIAIDAGMKKANTAEILLWDAGQFSIGNLTGKVTELSD